MAIFARGIPRRIERVTGSRATPAPDLDAPDVRMEGVFFCRAAANAPCVTSLDPGHYAYCVMVRSGSLILEMQSPMPAQIALEAGDGVALSGLAQHVFRAGPALVSAELGSFARYALSDGCASHGDVELVLGVSPNESLAIGSLMLGPIVVRPAEHPNLSRRLWRAVEMLEDEYADTSWIDRDLVIRRLAEILLVNMSRRVFAERPEAAGEVREPASRHLMKAIDAFFHSPEQDWTLADLAWVAGTSRSRFAEEFKAATGQTPGRIISRMRLTAVSHRLANEGLSVNAGAEESGYSSAAAFVRAFQREFGETPARWRRGQRRACADGHRPIRRSAAAGEA